VKLLSFIFDALIFKTYKHKNIINMRKERGLTLVFIVQIIIAALALVVLFFAYFKNNTLAKLVAFVILTAILIVQVLYGFA